MTSLVTDASFKFKGKYNWFDAWGLELKVIYTLITVTVTKPTIFRSVRVASDANHRPVVDQNSLVTQQLLKAITPFIYFKLEDSSLICIFPIIYVSSSVF